MADVLKTVHDADIIIFVVPHQFVRGICEQVKGKVKKGAVSLSLIKVGLIRSSSHVACG